MNRKLTLRCTTLCATGLLSAALTQPIAAQANTPEPPKPATEAANAPVHDRESYERWQASSVDRAYKLKYAASAQDANELLTGLRNMLQPITKIFLVPNSGTIVVHAPEEEQARVLKMLTSLDQPHTRYRLTYTLTEVDGTRKLGVQHFSMIVVSGQRMQMKQGSRLPISTGGTQFTYLDVGLNFEVTLQEVQGGAVLKEKVEQSSIAPDSTSVANPNPVLRQTQLEGTTSLVMGKPQVVGSLDVPSSTHHFDVEVLLEPAS